MITHTRLESSHLAGNLLADPSERDLFVYLPPGNLRRLSGILLDAGFNDDYNLHGGHRLLSHHLSEAGIAHEHRENPGNHGGRADERYQVALQWLAQVLDGDN